MISCLMVTQERKFAMAKQAIKDFHRQTFPARELVIVHDSGSTFQRDLIEFVKTYPHDDISVHFVDDTKSLGELRNITIEISKYSIVCQWDDDDLYHPNRLQAQFDLMRQQRSDFCFFTDQLHWFEQENVLFWDDWNVETYPMNLIQGTLMGKKALMGTYPALARGEDTPLIVDIVERGCRISKLENQGYLYIYTYNGENVWHYDHHAAISDWKGFSFERLQENKEALCRHLGDYDHSFHGVRMPHDQGVLELSF